MTEVYVGNKKYSILKEQRINNQDINITENGNYIAQDGYSGFGVVRVQVPETILDTITINPSKTEQTIIPEVGIDGYNEIIVNPVTKSIDNNIKAGNIKKGVEILGVTGSLEFVTDTLTVNPSTLSQTITPEHDGFNKVIVNPVTESIDSNIKAGNIKSGVTILGVQGTIIESRETTRNITDNGIYTAPTGYTGFSEVEVDVEAQLSELTITPTTSKQTFTSIDKYHGFSPVVVEGVSSNIDNNIIPENIKNGITILGVEGALTESRTQPINITSNGVYTPDSGYTGFSRVSVDINTVNNQDATFTKDGTYTPTAPYTGFGTVVVNTSSTLQDKTIEIDSTTPTEFTVTPDSGYAGLTSVTVDMSWIENQLQELNAGDASSEPQLQDITITEAGTYTASSGYDGLGTVTVDLDWVDLRIDSIKSEYTNTTVDEFLTNSLSQLNSDATRLRDYACYNMSMLSTVNLTSCERIGSNVFSGTALRILRIYTPTVCTLDDTTFPNTLRAIYVPSNLVNTYKSSTNWQNYRSLILPIS